MVQLFYYEHRGKACKKLLNYDGYPNKVLLYPYEGWAQPAMLTYWIIKTPWWSRSTCRIVEVCGAKKTNTTAKMCEKGNGHLYIKGKFKGSKDPDFMLYLTSNVSNQDFYQGYCMTGTLERGDKKRGQMQMTHFAMIKRKGY
jgi:hypothetical protein